MLLAGSAGITAADPPAPPIGEQPAGLDTPAAADPRRPGHAPFWQGPPGLDAPPAAPQPQDWAAANAAVAAFPRGHIDLLRWEAQHLGPPPTPASHVGARP